MTTLKNRSKRCKAHCTACKYSTPNLLESEYEELSNAKNLRQIVAKDLSRTKNQIHNWLYRYFSEYKEEHASWKSKSFIKIIKKYTLDRRNK